MSGGSSFVPAGWIPIDGSEMFDNNTWVTRQMRFTVLQPTIYNLVFFWMNDNSVGENPSLGIDNLVIESMGCAPASDFEVDAMSDSIYLSWPNLVSATIWDVKVSTTELNIQDMNNEVGDVYNDTVTSNRIALGGLNANMLYYAYVRTHCPDGTLQPWSELAIRTECLAISQLPYRENFDNYGTGASVFFPCWNRAQGYVSGTTTYPYLSNDQNHTPDGVGSLYFMTTSSSNTMNVMATPRIIADSIKNLRVGFYAYYNYAGHYIEVGVMTDPNNPTTFVPVDTLRIAVASSWNYLQADMSSYTGTGEYVAFRTGARTSYNYIYLDDIEIVDNRNCLQPEG